MTVYTYNATWEPPHNFSPLNNLNNDSRINLVNATSPSGTSNYGTDSSSVVDELTQTQDGKSRFRWTGDVTANGSAWYLQLFIYEDMTPPFTNQIRSFNSENEFGTRFSSGDTFQWNIMVYLNPKGKSPEGYPLYLEQLHKLSQHHTHVVYDPLNRRRNSPRA